MEALVDMAEGNNKMREEITNIINRQMETGRAAVQARGRKLLKRLSRETS